MENFYLTRKVDCKAAWNGTLDSADLRPPNPNAIEVGLAVARDVLTYGTYYDTHCWVFTPTSFAELFIEMAQLGLVTFACDFYFDTRRNEFEFIVSMAPSDDKGAILASWLRMKQGVRHETRYPETQLSRL